MGLPHVCFLLLAFVVVDVLLALEEREGKKKRKQALDTLTRHPISFAPSPSMIGGSEGQLADY
jgi:hypothetical protein